jgi:hypothetical protein
VLVGCHQELRLRSLLDHGLRATGASSGPPRQRATSEPRQAAAGGELFHSGVHRIICDETRGLRWNVLNSEIKWISGNITAEGQRKVAAALAVRIGEIS